MTTELRFEPSTLTIQAGDSVIWTNDSPIPHTATGDPNQNPLARSRPELVQLPAGAAAWGSPLLNDGEQFVHRFIQPGTYVYICIPHVLSGMRGTIVVNE